MLRFAVLLRAGFAIPDARPSRRCATDARSCPARPARYVSSISHDDAATAAAAALDVPAGGVQRSGRRALTRREYFESLAQALRVPAPSPFPVWISGCSASLREMLSRSLSVSNRKLRSVSAWKPKYRSVREGWPAVVVALRRVAAA